MALLNFYPRPRVEGDAGRWQRAGRGDNFYPRPRVEGDLCGGGH